MAATESGGRTRNTSATTLQSVTSLRRAATLAAASAVVLATAAPAAAQFAGGPHPTTVARSFRVVERGPQGTLLLSWASPERFAARRGTRLTRRPFVLERDGTSVFAREVGFPGSVERRTFAARPDGFSLSEELTRYRTSLLAAARAGRRVFAAASLGGRPAWRATVGLRANDCAGLRRGTATVWLSRATLLPLRVVESRRGRRVEVRRFSYSAVNADLSASDFAMPRLRARAFRADIGFRRTTPADAAGHLSYVPHLPTRLPTGFSLVVAGWAPRGGVTGPEGSNPADRELFAAVYRRGLERIDVTQRLSGGRAWRNDPFGGECLYERTERVRVRGHAATFGIGPEIAPHLYWREGPVRYTVSGPFPKRDLVAIAESLAPVP